MHLYHKLTHFSHKSPQKMQGFSMIEVLVSILVLSVGILGLIALETASLRSAQVAYNRSQATILIYNIADKMRANVDVDYAAAGPAAHGDCISYIYVEVKPGGCSPNEIAENDLQNWQDVLGQTLPEGAGDITSVGSVTTITVSWDDNRDGDVDDAGEELSMDFEL